MAVGHITSYGYALARTTTYNSAAGTISFNGLLLRTHDDGRRRPLAITAGGLGRR